MLWASLFPFLWPCVVFVSPCGRINTYKKAIAPKLLCPISIRLYRGGPPHFGNMIPAVRGTLEFTNIPGGRRLTEDLFPISCITSLGAFVNSFEMGVLAVSFLCFVRVLGERTC